MAAYNRELGRFILDGIPPAPRGMPQIEVTFDIDANGILAVSAKDKASGKEQTIRIEGSGGLKKDEIERMIKDAESHASEDHARREQVEKHNQLDSLLYQAGKTLADNRDKLPEADRTRAEGVLAEAKQDLESNDAARMDAARQRVEKEMHTIAELLYRAQTAGEGAGAAGGATASGQGPSDDVIDAEYTEEKGDRPN
jgi:molecular chaperone DnaK